jgi:hypothetical protein
MKNVAQGDQPFANVEQKIREKCGDFRQEGKTKPLSIKIELI